MVRIMRGDCIAFTKLKAYSLLVKIHFGKFKLNICFFTQKYLNHKKSLIKVKAHHLLTSKSKKTGLKRAI